MPRSAKSAAASSPPDGNNQPPLDQKPLLGLIGYNCRRAYLCIFEVFRERMATVDLRPVDYSVLVLVGANPRVNQKRLARALSIDPPNMATLLDHLEARKLVVRKRNPKDKRSQLLLLTPQGQKLCETAEAIVTKLEIDATSALTKDERAQLNRLAQKIFLR